MVIGIVTLPLQSNYGGILQAYALQTTLETLGHEVIIINKSRYRRLHPIKKPFIYLFRILRKYLFHSSISIRQEMNFNKLLDNLKRKQLYTDVFIHENIHVRDIESFAELKESDYDAIVVGSDQIWRKVYAYSMMQSLRDAYLYFAREWKNIRRIAYAASFGTDDWEYSKKDTAVCSSMLKMFDAVSIRELSGVRLCKEYLNYDEAELMIDPTLLLDKKHYIHLSDKAKQPHLQGGVFSYILDSRKETEQLELAVKNRTHLNVFHQYIISAFFSNDFFAPVIPVEAWIRAFEDCEMIITDSFHACVFAIIFNKPFWVVGNKDRGLSRFNSLLQIFHLEHRMVCIDDDFEKRNWEESINWIPINEKREFLKDQSINFLKKNL